MTSTQIIKKAIEEIEIKTFGVTQQFLKIHQVVYHNRKPTIARVDTEKMNGTAIVYFPVVGEKFYVAIYLDTEPEIAVRHVNTEPYHSVYFRATSNKFTIKELSALTTLEPTGGWDTGEQRKSGNSVYNFTSLEFEPNPEADEFEDKIKKLLDFLDQDSEGVRALVDKASGYIQVATSFHNGNTMLGGHHLDREIIRRLASLDLKIDFDLYANGNKFSESD